MPGKHVHIASLEEDELEEPLRERPTSSDDRLGSSQGSSFFSSAQNITISGGTFIGSPTIQAGSTLLHRVHGLAGVPFATGSLPASLVRAISAILTSTLNLSNSSRPNIPDSASTSPHSPQSRGTEPSSPGSAPPPFPPSGRDDIRSIDPMSRALSRPDYCKIYQDMLGDEGHGLPLWVPSPNLNLHPTYRRNGVSIGDIGIFTPFGAFDFLFNIFKPADDPVNAAAPPGFQPLTSGRPELSGIQRYPYFNEGVHIASQSITTAQNTGENMLQFEGQQNSAVLVMPTGASIEFLANVDRVKKYLALHAESFYRFVNDVDEGLGRGVRGGELCVIHTCVKSKTFALASIRGTTPTSTRLSYRRSERSSPDSRNENLRRLRHGWDISGSAQGKVGPVEADYQGLDAPEGSLENQCLFVGVISVDIHEPSTTEGSKGGDTKLSVSGGGTIPGGPSFVRLGKETSSKVVTDKEYNVTGNPFTEISRGVHSDLLSHAPEARVSIVCDRDWLSESRKVDPDDILKTVRRKNQIRKNNGAVMLEPSDIQPTDSEISAELTRVQQIGLKEYFFGAHSKEYVKGVDPTVAEERYVGVTWPSLRALVNSYIATPIPVHILSFSELLSQSSGILEGCSISDLRERCSRRPETDPYALPALSRRLLARFREFGEQNDLFEAISCYNFLEATLRDGPDRMAHLESVLGLIDSILCRYIRLRWDSDAERISALVLYCTTIPDEAFHGNATVWTYLNTRVSRGQEKLYER